MTDVQVINAGWTLGRAIAARPFWYRTETDLQVQVHALAVELGLNPEREVRLTPRDRIDLLIGRLGVEIKVAGAPHTVMRQLLRYAESDRVDLILLVTTRLAHLALPQLVGGKPLIVAPIGLVL